MNKSEHVSMKGHIHSMTDEDLLKYLRKFYMENGRIPKVKDFTNNDEYPCSQTYQNHFGSWNNAIIMAFNEPFFIVENKNFIEYEKIISTFGYVPYFENPDCVSYIRHIRDYLESILDIERLSYKGINNERKSVDFIMNLDGNKLKVKLIVSRMSSDDIGPFWKYNIEHNKNADAFLLIAFGDREYLELQHMWFIISEQILQTKKTKMSMEQFRDRGTLKIRNSEHIIDYMSKFELKEKLEQLKTIMKMGYHKPNDEHKDFVRLLLTKKQNHIFNTTGVKKSIRSIAEDAIERGLGPKEISVENVVLKIKKRRLRIIEGEMKEQSQEERENDAYNLVIEKQKEIFDTTGNMRTIKDVVDAAIELGIEYVK